MPRKLSTLTTLFIISIFSGCTAEQVITGSKTSPPTKITGTSKIDSESSNNPNTDTQPLSSSTGMQENLKRDSINKLIEEADLLANSYDFKKCLNKLETAYGMKPTTTTANRIIDRYTKYSIRQIAYEFSQHTDSLNEKTVSVANFSNMSGVVSEKGMHRVITEEFCDALTNLSDLKVVERVSLDKVLKEMELGLSGIVSEESKKEVGNLVNAEAMAVGWVGNVRSTLKIYAKLVLVETGVIIASMSVNLLGWDIQDTAESADFNITVWTNENQYNIGETATIFLRTNRDCYATLLNIRSNGEILQLFPNKYDKDNFVRANIEYSIPSSSDIYALSVSEPPGIESIKAIATSRPVSIGEIKNAVSTDSNILTSSDRAVSIGGDSFFREISNAEMRGWHEVLRTRGMEDRGLEPRLKTGVEYTEGDNKPSGETIFEHAVNTCVFETIR